MASDKAVDGMVTYLAGVYGDHVSGKYQGVYRASIREHLKGFDDLDLVKALPEIEARLDELPPWSSLVSKIKPFLEEQRKRRQEAEHTEAILPKGLPSRPQGEAQERIRAMLEKVKRGKVSEAVMDAREFGGGCE